MTGRRRRGKNSSVFLFNPLFIIIPLGKSSIIERKKGRREREATRDLIREIKCRSLKFVVLRFMFVVLASRQGSLR